MLEPEDLQPLVLAQRSSEALLTLLHSPSGLGLLTWSLSPMWAEPRALPS